MRRPAFMLASDAGEVICCGKLDNRVSLGAFSPHAQAKVRLHVEHLASDKSAAPISVSIGDNKIWFDGRLWELDPFISQARAAGIRRVIVLTSKEYIHIAELVSSNNIHVDVLETNYPIFSGIKYKRCARSNYEVLKKHLRKLDQLKIREGNLSKDLACGHQRSVVKQLRSKNGYDGNFFFAYKDPYQEVFKLKEERPDRLIIAFDFNSMYVDSMKGGFCNPEAVKFNDFRGLNIDLTLLKKGIYLVRLRSAKQGFFLNHHPFRYKRLGRSYYFSLRCGDTIETLLNDAEIEYFSSFFESVEVLEGLVSSDVIEHPLLKKGVALYKQRLYHAKRGDSIKESVCKVSMQHMHSATNQKRYVTKTFNSLEKLFAFVSEKFLLNTEGISQDRLIDFIAHHKYFRLNRTPKGYKLTYLDIDSRANIYSLSAQVVANARMKILKTLEIFLSYPSVELCYANVDSIHLSIRRDLADAFLEHHRGYISGELGALKIEAIADQGYWFDVGRYWLKKEGKVLIFKNKGFNTKNETEPFLQRRKIIGLVKTPAFSYVRSYVARIENSFNYSKRMVNLDPQESRFVRFQFEEVRDMDVGNLTEAKERFNSAHQKTKLFQSISSGI